MQEIFKDIPGYKGLYQVSNLGRVKSLGRLVSHKIYGSQKIHEKILKPGINRNGYLLVILCLDGNRKTATIHQLVAMAFLGHKPGEHSLDIDHDNNIRTDNRLSNLILRTRRENSSKDQWRYNRSSKYVGVSWCKQTRKWRAAIYFNKKKKTLGRFSTEIEAHNAYQYYLKHGRRKSDTK